MEDTGMAHAGARIDQNAEAEALHGHIGHLENKIHELEYEIKVLTEDLATLMYIGRRTLNKSVKTSETLKQVKAENNTLTANADFYREQMDKKSERIKELESSKGGS